MAILSQMQKEANKAHIKARDKAFNERRLAYRSALNEAQHMPAVKQMAMVMEEAIQKFESAMDARSAKESELRAKIDALAKEIKDLEKTMGLDQINQDRQMATEAYFKAKREAESIVEQDFSDISGVHSAPFWEAAGHFGHKT